MVEVGERNCSRLAPPPLKAPVCTAELDFQRPQARPHLNTRRLFYQPSIDRMKRCVRCMTKVLQQRTVGAASAMPAGMAETFLRIQERSSPVVPDASGIPIPDSDAGQAWAAKSMRG